MADREADRRKEHMIGGSGMSALLHAMMTCGTSSTFIASTTKIFDNSFTGNSYTRIGHLCEEVIIQAYDTALEDSEMHGGAYIVESNERHKFLDVRHRESDHHWQLVATPDMVLSNGTVVEIKTKIKPGGTRRYITSQHALQLVYYMCFLDQPEGSLVYFTPDNGTIDLLTEYRISLSPLQREYFRKNLITCCEMIGDLYAGERIPWVVKNLATILYDYKRLFIESFSFVTPLVIHEWPIGMEELLEHCRQGRRD